MKKYLLSIALCSVSLVCQAGFNEGVTAYEKGDYQTALKAWKAIAEQKPTVTGDFEWHSSQSKNTVEAQYALALLYWQGKGVAQNYQEAEKWLVSAATSGHSEAQLKLAYLYLEGLNGKANMPEASKWFEQSAQQGNVNAQYNLGLLYWKGLGVTQDTATAKKWLTAAASQGDDSAKELLAEIKASPVPTEQPAVTPPQTAVSSDAPQAVAAQPAPPAATPNEQPAVTPPQTAVSSGVPQAVAAQPASAATTPNEQPVATPTQTAVSSGVPQVFSAQPTLPAVATPVQASATQTVDTQTGSPSPAMNDYYAIQLIGSPKQNDVQLFMESWRDTLNPLIMTDKIKKSQRIFIVAYGSYSSMAEAKQAITDLPPELRKSKPWVIKMHGDTLAQ